MRQAKSSRVVVVDFGAQYAQLIARRIRDLHVYSEIVPYSITAEGLLGDPPKAIILSGGPKSVNEAGAPTLDPKIFELGIPILGICYGAQLLAVSLGGKVERNDAGEYGRTELRRKEADTLLGTTPISQKVWMSHFDSISEPPLGATVTSSTDGAKVASFEDLSSGICGVQYHPEVTHTEHGRTVLSNFIFEVAKCDATWTNFSIIEESIALIKERVKDSRVICALSGGVDSSVAAALVHEAIGDQLTCVYVDTGLMRSGETESVIETFRDRFAVDLIAVDASERFFEVLSGVVDPEQKRKAIGETFIRVFEDLRPELGRAEFLVQGTLYPDVIESGTKDAAKIKSHHNVGGLPDDMDFELIEPLRALFKDEVRAIGEELGLPEKMVWRQPFPGPGLAVRILGEVTKEAADTLRQADLIVSQEIEVAGLTGKLWQSFAILATNLRSVGVMGDERTYANPVILRAVESDDAMSADWARIPYEVLERISTRIVAEVKGVNRVVYDITSKPPGTIEWE